MDSEILNIRELSARLKVSHWTLYAWSSQKFIPSIKLRGKLLFDWAVIQKWLEKNSLPGRTVHRLKIEEKMEEQTQ